MRLFCRLLLLFLASAAMVFVTGCADTGGGTEESTSSESSGNGDSSSENGGEEEVVIRDTHYKVIEKRQSGGELVPGEGVSALTGEPRMTRTPLESMIIVEGNMTGNTSAYLLPPRDYNRVAVGHRLLESTLARWESTDMDHIPAPPPPPESPLKRSRTGGVAENYVF